MYNDMPFALTERVVSSFEIGTARSDNKVCGTETEYQQHNLPNMKIKTFASLVNKKSHLAHQPLMKWH